MGAGIHSWHRAVIALMLTVAAGASAHHSAAMFDAQKKLTLSGTVRQFQWTNPHCYIQLVVKNARGKDEEWSLELGAPMYLYNRGWRPSTVKVGDQLTVTLQPLRNGERGGLLVEAKAADGRALGKQPVKAP